MTAPTLTDGVATLTGHRPEDAPEILRGRQLPEVERAWFGRKLRDLDDARHQIEYALACWAEEENFFWGVCDPRKRGRPAPGFADRHHSSRGAGSVLDIWLLREHRRRGIACRAILLVLDYVFDVRGMPWVDLEILPDNEPAVRLARELGFTPIDGQVRGFTDREQLVLPYRMTREVWDRRDGAG